MSEEKKTHPEHKYSVTFVSNVEMFEIEGDQKVLILPIQNSFRAMFDVVSTCVGKTDSFQFKFGLSYLKRDAEHIPL